MRLFELLEAVGRMPLILQGLAAEAKKAGSFEEFEKDFLRQIKHGLYWHWTDDPSFRIDPNRGPRDMSSMGSGSEVPGALMISSDIDAWSEYGARPYAAIIDMSDVPREAYYQVKRGFGNEFYVADPSKARVVQVLPRAKALAKDRNQRRYLPQNSDALRGFYEQVVEGNPLTEWDIQAYHGTDRAFDPSEFQAPSTSKNAWVFGSYEVTRHGIFFTGSKRFAKQFGKNVMACQLRLKNVADMDMDEDLLFDFADTFDPHGPERDLWLQAYPGQGYLKKWQYFDNELGKRFVAWLKGQGYDGARFREDTSDDGDEIEATTYVVFDSNKIRCKNPNLVESIEENPYEETLPRGTTLYHGTLEPFSKEGLRPSHYDKALWTTDSPLIARSYIPSQGASIILSAYNLRLPSQNKSIQAIQQSIGINYDRLDDVRWGPGGRAEAFPLPSGWDHIPTEEEVIQRLGEAGYEPKYPPDGYEIGLINDKPMSPGAKTQGRLFTLTVQEPLKIYDTTAGGQREGDLMEPDYHRHDWFEAARKAGYDGIKITDFAQTDYWGNYGHDSIGLFQDALSKLSWEESEAMHPGDEEWSAPLVESKSLPTKAAIARGREMLASLSGNTQLCGDSDVVDGWLIETHTLGCRNAADEPEENWIESHWAIYDEYARDGVSYVKLDENTGIFVTWTPQRPLSENCIDCGDNDERAEYLHGSCHSLTYAAWKRFGGKMIGMFDMGMLAHSVLQAPNGKWIDAAGIVTPESLIARYVSETCSECDGDGYSLEETEGGEYEYEHVVCPRCEGSGKELEPFEEVEPGVWKAPSGHTVAFETVSEEDIDGIYGLDEFFEDEGMIDYHLATFGHLFESKISEAPADLSDIPDTLYHGTDAKYLMDIIRHGIRPGGGSSPHRTKTKSGVFLTDCMTTGLFYGDAHSKSPCIIEVNPEGLDTNPDYDDAGDSILACLDALSQELGREIQVGAELSPEEAETAWHEIEMWEGGRQVEVEERDGRYFVTVDPWVQLPVNTSMFRSAPSLYDDMDFDMDGNPVHGCRQFMISHAVPAENIVGFWIDPGTAKEMGLPPRKPQTFDDYQAFNREVEDDEDLDEDETFGFAKIDMVRYEPGEVAITEETLSEAHADDDLYKSGMCFVLASALHDYAVENFGDDTNREDAIALYWPSPNEMEGLSDPSQEAIHGAFHWRGQAIDVDGPHPVGDATLHSVEWLEEKGYLYSQDTDTFQDTQKYVRQNATRLFGRK